MSEGDKEKQETAVLEKIIDQLCAIFDPEIPVSIYDLGLIYRIDVEKVGENKYDIQIDMTLTAPGCPVAETMPLMVHDAIKELEEANEVTVALVWDPPWDKSRMSDEAKLEMNMF
ncbi:MAG: iron-sulfur cluster assembly protein [Alphaproteobacteria bacterium]|nr:iron-sulfur cluster assembly protein [Alphaproteobacteria bacterium]